MPVLLLRFGWPSKATASMHSKPMPIPAVNCPVFRSTVFGSMPGRRSSPCRSWSEDLFRLADRNPNDYFEYRRLNETCRYFWDDHTYLTAWADRDAFAREVESQLGEPADHLLAHLADSAAKYHITEKLFLHRSLHKLATWFNRDALYGYLNLPKLEVFKTMNRANEQRFQNPKLVQLFNRYATYNGSDPYQTPATMNIIPHLEYNIGAFFPKEGMIGITNNLGPGWPKNWASGFHFNTRGDGVGDGGRTDRGRQNGE